MVPSNSIFALTQYSSLFSCSGTIRRFLEHYGEEIDFVVFISDGQEPYYSKVMPFYFPRSAEEEAYAAKALPSALGNEYGEPVIAERTIRITSNPIVAGGWSLNSLCVWHTLCGTLWKA